MQRNPVQLSDMHGRDYYYAIGDRRVWWHDPSHDWQVRVSVDLGNGRLSIMSGPCWDYEGDSPDGMWGEESAQGCVHHEVGGYNAHGILTFAKWVQNEFVGDEFILPAVEHLLAAQQAKA